MEIIPDLDFHYGKELKVEQLCNMKQMGLSTLSSIAKTAVLLLLWHIFPQTVEKPGQTFLVWNVNRGTFWTVGNKLWVHSH